MTLDVRDATKGLYGEGRGRILLALAVGWLFIVGGRFLVPAVLPQVTGTFDVGNTGGGLAVTVIWATYALVQSPAGVLTDRRGERILLIGSPLLSAASVVVLGFSPVFLAFLAGCAAFGFATGLYGPPRGTALSRTFPGDDSVAIGLTLAAGSIGSAILPFLAGALVKTIGWRLIIAGLFPPLAFAAGLGWWAMPEWTATAGSAETSMGKLAGDVLQAVRVRSVAVAVVAVALMLFVFQGLTAFYVTYLVDVEGLNQRVAAGLFALLFISGAVAQVGGGFLADRLGARRVLIAASAVGILSVGAIPFIDGSIPYAVLSIVLGIRLAIAPVSNAYIIGVLPESVTGSAWGVLRTVFFLFGATASTVVGLFADNGLFDEAFLVLAALSAVATVLYFALPRQTVQLQDVREVGE